MHESNLSPPTLCSAATPAAARACQPRARPLLLVVDDEPLMQDTLRITLEEAGFEVACAADGRAGLAGFDQLRPDLVITDANMPDMNGFELCAAIRAHPAGRHAPILMLTAAGDSASIRRAFSEGATDFATKPLQDELIGYRVRYLLEGSRNVRALLRSQARLASAQRIGRIGHWDLELADDRLTVSEEVCRIIGAERAGAPRSGGAFLAFVHPDDRAAARQWLRDVAGGDAAAMFEHRLLRPDGTLRHAVLQAELTGEEGGGRPRLEGVLQDITERRAAEQRIRYLAMYDGLTGLPNRRLCAEQLEGALARATRNKTPLAVLIIGLDGFTRINEAGGHAAGDRLLARVGERLCRCVREGDHVARVDTGSYAHEGVARLAGDTFAAILPDLARAEDAAGVAVRVQECVAQPCFINGQTLFVTASVGIAIHGIDGACAEDLLKNAESAMHFAKRGGHGGLRFFTAGMNADAARKLALANDLRMALAQGQFCLHYQPQLDLESGRIIAAEALLRWEHPERGRIPPLDFISLAEELGLIVQIGAWVIRAACAAARAWQQPGQPPVGVAVNVSPKQFREPGFLPLVQAALAETGLAPQCLELEVTEGVMVGDPAATIANMQALRALGVQLAVDDFGTGYSSLSYLRQFPVQRLKIDQSFVRGLDRDTHSASIAQAVIVLGHALDLKVIAEGVETDAHLTLLRDLGCDEVQGYLIARPMPQAQFADFLDARQALPA